MPTPFLSLWPRPLNEDGGAASWDGEAPYFALLCGVSIETDLDIERGEDEGFDPPNSGIGLWDVSPSETGKCAILTLSYSVYADVDLDIWREEDASFALPDLGGGFWDVFPSDWDGIGAGMDS